MQLTVIIPAGGSGSRIGGTPKQYRQLGGRPILWRTVEAFGRWHSELNFIVAVPADDVSMVTEMLSDAPGSHLIVPGGSTRQASVYAGLREARTSPRALALIHDAVRPFVSKDLLDRLLAAAHDSPAVAPALPVADTLRVLNNGLLGETVDRSRLVRMQTPQVFELSAILKAHESAHEKGWEGTDDVALYDRFVGQVSFVAGASTNFKITTAQDLKMAAAVWSHSTGSAT